ncbi:hypothetical protein OZ811_003343 [Yersinia enterocolitica]
MPSNNIPLLAFNRGVVSRLALARTDIDRIALSAEVQTNWMPRILGSMMLRPGTGYIGQTKGNKKAKYLKFIFATDDSALLELTDSVMRIWINDALVTRPLVSTVVVNSGFITDLSGWTAVDEAGAVSQWTTAGAQLQGTGFNSAIIRQLVAVSALDVNKQHAIRVNITRGPVTIRVGSSVGSDNYVTETSLGTGINSLTFTPAGNFYIQISNRTDYPVIARSIATEVSGVLELPTPWTESDLGMVRYDQSGDVIFVACRGKQQRRIERRANGSWSVVIYESTDGPFGIENVSGVRLTPSGISGVISLTASAPIFRVTHIGSLFRLESSGQTVNSLLGGEGQFTDYIKVTGIDTSRNVTIIKTQSGSGPWSGTLTLQRSVSEPGAWVDVTTYNMANGTTTYNDNLNNQIIYYRIGFKTGNWTSGNINVSLQFAGGSRTGIVKVTGFTSDTNVNAVVLSQLGGIGSTDIWFEGDWSDKKGWPSAVALYEGRLWWAGGDRFWGSVSDAFSSFDDETEGDSGPISGTIGSGPVDTINWLVPLLRLIVGTEGAEASLRSSSFDEPLTPTNFGIKYPSTQGSDSVAALKIDSGAIFVQRSGARVFELNYDSSLYDYASADMMSLCPEMGLPSIIAIDAQRQPDTRIHCVRSDGAVAVQIFDRNENVKCWVLVDTDGLVEEVVILPGKIEDQVYYVVNRNGIRCLEKWALESECRGGQLSKLADSFISYSGIPVTELSGLDHLEGRPVVVWADGFDIGELTVADGKISLASGKSNVTAGLGYRAKFKSTKLAYSAGMGTALTQRKRVERVGLILADTHAQGIQFGPDFESLDDMPREERGEFVADGKIWDAYDNDAIEFPGSWDTDSRICIQASAPRPATVLAAIVGLTTHDK